MANYLYARITEDGTKPSSYICNNPDKFHFVYLSRKQRRWKKDKHFRKLRKIFFAPMLPMFHKFLADVNGLGVGQAVSFISALIRELKLGHSGLILKIMTYLIPLLSTGSIALLA